MERGTIVVAIERPLRELIANEHGEIALEALGYDLVSNESTEPWSVSDLIEQLDPSVRAIVTAWRSPRIDGVVLNAAPNLEIVAHAAGTVKPYYDAAVWRRGVRVTHAAPIIAEAVAEYTIGAILVGLRSFVTNHAMVMRGEWKAAADNRGEVGGLLATRRVGVIAASQVGQRVIPLLRAFTSDIVLYDPFIDGDGARALGVERVDLDELMRTSDVVTIHAPVLPETWHMLGRQQLELMKPGALLVNSARSWMVDQGALCEVLFTGRINAVLDVFDEEPLPAGSPFRGLPNVVLTPHVAGFTAETRSRHLTSMVEELERHFAGCPLEHEIMLEDLARMA